RPRFLYCEVDPHATRWWDSQNFKVKSWRRKHLNHPPHCRGWYLDFLCKALLPIRKGPLAKLSGIRQREERRPQGPSLNCSTDNGPLVPSMIPACRTMMHKPDNVERRSPVLVRIVARWGSSQRPALVGV